MKVIFARIAEAQELFRIDDEAVDNPDVLLGVPRLVQAKVGGFTPEGIYGTTPVWLNPKFVRIVWEQDSSEDVRL